MTPSEKVFFILEFPFDWIRKLTIPPCEQEKYDKNLCIAWPIGGIIFIFWGINLSMMTYLKYGAPTSVILFIFLFFS